MSAVYSSQDQLNNISTILSKYIRLPVSTDTIPGALLEAILAHVREGAVLPTYDYIDVLDKNSKVGWSIKSTKSSTPVTWKRAKIRDKENFIRNSFESEEGIQKLGDEIIEFCNSHARESLSRYNLEKIGYSRLILFPTGEAKYFEKLLCTKDDPNIFDPSEFYWKWSNQKITSGKEQLRALHGFHKPTNKKWWAWHGLGENQLHFSGESTWWPNSDDPHTKTFTLPTEDERLSFDRLVDLLDKL